MKVYIKPCKLLRLISLHIDNRAKIKKSLWQVPSCDKYQTYGIQLSKLYCSYLTIPFKDVLK